jgi:hypothetical protein
VCLESHPRFVGVVDYMQQMQPPDPVLLYPEPRRQQPWTGLLVWYLNDDHGSSQNLRNVSFSIFFLGGVCVYLTAINF